MNSKTESVRTPIILPREYQYKFQEFEVVLLLEKSLRTSTQVIPAGKCRLERVPDGSFNLVITEELKEGQI